MKLDTNRVSTKITISDNGMVHMSITVQMRDFEIAQLFGVFQQNIKSNIRAILKSGVVTASYEHGATQQGNTILPDYYDLEMITALAFRVRSPKANMFRRWIMKRLSNNRLDKQQHVFIQLSNNSTLN